MKVTDFGFRFPTHNNFCSVENRIAEVSDILFSVRAPVGRINIANKKLIIGRGLSAIHHKENLQSFLFYQLKHVFSEEDTIGSGAIFNSVTKEDMCKIKVICPSDNYDKNFDDLIKPLDAQIGNFNYKIQNLSRTRDLLLPKLMSGDVEVYKVLGKRRQARGEKYICIYKRFIYFCYQKVTYVTKRKQC